MILFSEPQGEVQLNALSVGSNGVVMVAYDAPEGGKLLAQTSAMHKFDTDEILHIRAHGIRRVEVYQMTVAYNDGIVLDDLCFRTDTIPDVSIVRTRQGELVLR